MWLKLVIIVLFISVLISLSSALVFLLKDVEALESKRTLLALGIRIVLAALLLASIFYVFIHGELSSTAPWDSRI